MDSFFQVNLIESSWMVRAKRIDSWKCPCIDRDSLRVHKEEVIERVIGLFGPGHFLMKIIDRDLTNDIWLDVSLPLLKNQWALLEFLFDDVPLNLSQHRVFFFKIVYAVGIFNDLCHLAVETGAKHLTKSRALAANSCETPKEHRHIFDLEVFVVFLNRFSHLVDEGNGGETQTTEGVNQYHCRTHIVLIEVSLDCWE